MVINMMLQNQVTAKVRRRQAAGAGGPYVVRLYYGNDGFRDEVVDSLADGINLGATWARIEPDRGYELIDLTYGVNTYRQFTQTTVDRLLAMARGL